MTGCVCAGGWGGEEALTDKERQREAQRKTGGTERLRETQRQREIKERGSEAEKGA